jgi:Ser/Thr protein kinase RdoA (MazF antagonist)
MTLDNSILQAATQKYGVSVQNLIPLKGGFSNHVYQFTRAGNEYVLRITPPNNDSNLIAATAILAWQNFLVQNHASVTKPLPSHENHWVEVIEYNSEPYFITAFEKAPGILSETMPLEQWDEGLFQELGKTVGKMHALAVTYIPASNSLKRPHWDHNDNLFNPNCPHDSKLENIYQRRDAIIGQITDFPKDSDGYGMIHCDLHFANFFVDPKNHIITIFDFDDCAYGWYVMDIATLLFDLCVVYSHTDKEAFATLFLDNFLKGYLTEKSLSAAWITHLPVFLKLLESSLYIDVYRYWNPDDHDSWSSKFMPNRKYSIEKNLPYINLDFSQFLSI